MGITRDKFHKKRATGGRQKTWRKKRQFSLGRQASNTKLSPNTCVRRMRVRGGNYKFRALRLDNGNFSWCTEATTRKTRVLDVVYNSSNNELVSTKTLVKNAIIQVDASPFKQWYIQHYGVELGQKGERKEADAQNKGEEKESKEKAKEAAQQGEVAKSKKVMKKLEDRNTTRSIDATF